MTKVKKLNVAIIFGGRSGEHEVSLVSATSVIKNLDKQKYNIIQIGITKGGEWLVGNDVLKFLKTGQGRNFKQEALSPDAIKNKLVGKKIDVVFPVLHGTYGEDGVIQGLLELTNVPYVGSGILGSAMAMDKITQKTLCGVQNILMPDWIWLTKKEWQWTKKSKLVFKKWLAGTEERLGYPMFVKPSNMGSSVGISKVNDRQELIQGVELAIKYDRRILIEQAIEAAMEIEIAVLGNDKPEVSMAGQVVTSNEFYDYNAKYVDGKSDVKIPAELPAEVIQDLKNIALQAFSLMDCSGLARVDFLVNQRGKDWNIYLSELNTMPGFTSISMYPKLWEASGLSYQKLLNILIKLALEKYREKNKLATSFKVKTDWYKN